jgi:prevent-host-death family protein
MVSLGIFEAKNRLSEICEQVAASGEPVLIRRRDEPLVRIVPVGRQSAKESVWDTVQESAHNYGELGDEWSAPERLHNDARVSPL